MIVLIVKKAIEENEYLHETVSIDAIRIYINSLKNFGCIVNNYTKNRVKYYYIESHPFELKIDDSLATSIIKIYKAISKSIDFDDFIALQAFFKKFSAYVVNEKLKNKIQNISPLSNIDSHIINGLRKYVNNKNEITVLYNSSISGQKNITILADRLYISNNKLYLAGVNSEYKNYYSFLVSNIIKIVSVNLAGNKLQMPIYTVKYEYFKTDNEVLELLSNERIIEETDKKLVIEISSKNKFDITQRVLSFSNKCRVISPQDYRQEIIDCLKKMKEEYFAQIK